MSEIITRHLLIRGRVQGVGFRNYIEYKAQQLGVCGWIRNRSDGSVEAVFQGPATAVDAMIGWARRGPRAGGSRRARYTRAAPRRTPAALRRTLS